MVGLYCGGWLEAAKIYRQSVLTEPWTAEGKLSQRPSTSQALIDPQGSIVGENVSAKAILRTETLGPIQIRFLEINRAGT